MKHVTIRLELRIPEEVHEFLETEALSRKLTFEGLILMYLEERMTRDREQRRHVRPPQV
jgi:predicted HicB family RNase H-like nuclease